jgi:HSP20 family molecular chaperone IbpA
MDDDGFDVQLYEDALVIEGERHVDACESGGFYHAAELRQGRFHVEITLPVDVDPDGVHVAYERGILRVELPKARPPASGR